MRILLVIKQTSTWKFLTKTNDLLQHFHHHREDGSMSWMTGLKRDRFVFVGIWSGLLLFPTAYLAIGGPILLVLRLSQVGTLTDSRLVILRVLIFSQHLCQRLLMLWVILFFYFGVLSLRGTLSAGSNLGDSGDFVRLHGTFRSNWFHVASV